MTMIVLIVSGQAFLLPDYNHHLAWFELAHSERPSATKVGRCYLLTPLPSPWYLFSRFYFYARTRTSHDIGQCSLMDFCFCAYFPSFLLFLYQTSDNVYGRYHLVYYSSRTSPMDYLGHFVRCTLLRNRTPDNLATAFYVFADFSRILCLMVMSMTE
jgi:hypothetical protein